MSGPVVAANGAPGSTTASTTAAAASAATTPTGLRSLPGSRAVPSKLTAAATASSGAAASGTVTTARSAATPAARMLSRTANAAATESHTTPTTAVVTVERSASNGSATPSAATAIDVAATELPSPRSTGHISRVASAPRASPAQRAASTGLPAGSTSWTAAYWIAARWSHGVSGTSATVASRIARTPTAKRASPAVATQSEVNVAARVCATAVSTATPMKAPSPAGSRRTGRAATFGST